MTATQDFEGPAASWRIGAITVHRVDELALTGMGPRVFADLPSDLVPRTPWLAPDHVDASGELVGAVQTFAVEVAGRKVLVDTGIGNGKTLPNPRWSGLDTPFLDRLAAIGFPPESVDLVVNTHLHADHIGWNTRLDNGRWVPTFRNARYLTTRVEYEYWYSADLPPERRRMFTESVDPVRDSGLLDLVDVPPTGLEVVPGLTLLPAPGHTPGQVTVRLAGAGGAALITADCMHHPVQLARTEVCSVFDTDPAQAVRTRQALLAEVAQTDTLLLGTHFAPPTGGRVRRDGDGYRLVSRP
ncbi:MBL fold metallo-hydrolase [Streptomyces silvisoli]|uniref:MBL fold metallo-hydrolase n=1 Tax=Streptomyces silvisoli TaxID=3034235 RepID=A0ABT5ZH21_9ACTN|nr:MBL fold metallo-hydrolase [Streptomyces silvisoli]MDF3289128.1 MBL fold metallo-hydrolase [Streptomyces silvisoli]